MALLPNIEELKPYFTTSQYRWYLTVHWATIILFVCLLVLCILNMYRVIYKQGKWRNILLLSFYFFSFTAIFFRLIFQVFFFDAYFDKTSWVMFCGTISPYAKLCVGLLQCYMVFELAQRLKPA